MRTFDSRADSRAATNNERLSSASRAKVLHEYVEAKQQQFGAARDFDMRVMALADTAGSGIRQSSAATHSRTGIVQRGGSIKGPIGGLGGNASARRTTNFVSPRLRPRHS